MRTSSAHKILLTGRVQGVGFRPFVWRVASAMKLRGTVRNTQQGVEIAIDGDQQQTEEFISRIERQKPRAARIEKIQITGHLFDIAPHGFDILPSTQEGAGTSIPPDMALCRRCRRELTNPQDRRFGYPFISCTECGPRFSVIDAMPYDRAHTTMREFPLCNACDKEYTNPANRRFHAESLACNHCGPKIWLVNENGADIIGRAEALIATASRWLSSGKVVAIKGIGGFHLACDALSCEAINLLRERKCRPAKPLAIMVRDIAMAETLFTLSEAEKSALGSAQAPIVLLQKQHARLDLPQELAPQQSHIGIMLAYSPLHFMLLSEIGGPLVMTSGNTHGAPVCIDNTQAIDELSEIADCFVLHNRVISHRCDDSLISMVNDQPRMQRRARGYVPQALDLPCSPHDIPTLALGGDLKNTFCLSNHGKAYLSAHNGDIGHPDCYSALKRALKDYSRLLNIKPQAIAVDLHPDYLTHRLGEELSTELKIPLVGVQHHHAHMVSCLVENAVPADKKVLGIVLDGLGYGTDATLWGSEILLGDYRSFTRVASLKPFALLGGNKASREPWRNLLALLAQTNNLALIGALPWVHNLTTDASKQLLTCRDRFMQTSSAGRFFDAVAALLNVAPNSQSFEGQAAMALESLAADAWPVDDGYPLHITGDALLMIDSAPLWPALIDDLRRGETKARIAAKFHLSLVKALATAVKQLMDKQHIAVDTIALSGGVMQNRLLSSTLEQELSTLGLHVYNQIKVPANDGGIALGQAAIALATLTHTDKELC